jgi:hypothetical protein
MLVMNWQMDQLKIDNVEIFYVVYFLSLLLQLWEDYGFMVSLKEIQHYYYHLSTQMEMHADKETCLNIHIFISQLLGQIIYIELFVLNSVHNILMLPVDQQL